MLMNAVVFSIILELWALNVSLYDGNKKKLWSRSVKTVSREDVYVCRKQRWLITFWAGELFHQLNCAVHLFRRHQEAHNMIHQPSDIITKGLAQLSKESYGGRNYKGQSLRGEGNAYIAFS